MNADTAVLTDTMWEGIEHKLPAKASDLGAAAVDNHRFLEAVFWGL